MYACLHVGLFVADCAALPSSVEGRPVNFLLSSDVVLNCGECLSLWSWGTHAGMSERILDHIGLNGSQSLRELSEAEFSITI